MAQCSTGRRIEDNRWNGSKNQDVTPAAAAGRAPCYLASARSVAARSSATRSSPKHPIRGAPVQDVRVDHGGAHVTVSEQFLDRANVVTVLEHRLRLLAGQDDGQMLGAFGVLRHSDGALEHHVHTEFERDRPCRLGRLRLPRVSCFRLKIESKADCACAGASCLSRPTPADACLEVASENRLS